MYVCMYMYMYMYMYVYVYMNMYVLCEGEPRSFHEKRLWKTDNDNDGPVITGCKQEWWGCARERASLFSAVSLRYLSHR